MSNDADIRGFLIYSHSFLTSDLIYCGVNIVWSLTYEILLNKSLDYWPLYSCASLLKSFPLQDPREDPAWALHTLPDSGHPSKTNSESLGLSTSCTSPRAMTDRPVCCYRIWSFIVEFCFLYWDMQQSSNVCTKCLLFLFCLTIKNKWLGHTWT